MRRAVELRSFNPDMTVRRWLRFELLEDEEVLMTTLDPKGRDLWEKTTVNGKLPGPSGELVGLQDGEAFLRALAENRQGSRFWVAPADD